MRPRTAPQQQRGSYHVGCVLVSTYPAGPRQSPDGQRDREAEEAHYVDPADKASCAERHRCRHTRAKSARHKTKADEELEEEIRRRLEVYMGNAGTEVEDAELVEPIKPIDALKAVIEVKSTENLDANPLA